MAAEEKAAVSVINLAIAAVFLSHPPLLLRHLASLDSTPDSNTPAALRSCPWFLFLLLLFFLYLLGKTSRQATVSMSREEV